LKLSTVRIDLMDNRPAEALIVTNIGAESMLTQFQIVRWDQVSGHDETGPTTDLIANPAIVDIAAGKRQVVRIGYIGKLQKETEGTYRLFVHEVPKQDRERAAEIETVLNISVPVFVSPLAKSEPKLEASALQSADGATSIVIHNLGAVHLRVTSFKIGTGPERPNTSGPFYVLPGASMPLPSGPLPAGHMAPEVVNLVTDAGAIELPVLKGAGSGKN
jgi:fimbrial chaperone protein